MSASSSSGWIPKGPQVFINFLERELSTNFLDYLETALKKANINVFIDDKYNLELAFKLEDLLVKIRESKVAVVVFSKGYTTSVWCLDELVTIKECMDKETLTGIPIFYKVDPSVVGRLEGPFGDNFRRLKHNNRHDLVRTQKWKKALTSMTNFKGMHLPENSGQSERNFIEEIVKKLKTLLDNIPTEKTTDTLFIPANKIFIPANKIDIEDSENPTYWTWSSIQEAPNQEPIEIATLKEVYWLNISGTYYTRKLTPETKYKVVLVVKLEGTAAGWHEPVSLNLMIVMRDKSEILQEQILYLDDYNDEDEWVDIKVGDFVAPPTDAPARIFFEMSQHDDNVRKTGLVVKGVAFLAMNENSEAKVK